MSDVDRRGIPDSNGGLSQTVSAALATLRLSGAAGFDPVRWHYLQVLSGRASVQPEPVKRILDARLAQALTVFQARFEQARVAATAAIDKANLQHPDVSVDVQALLAAGDLRGVHRHIASLDNPAPAASLRDVVRQLAPHAALPVDAGFDGVLHGGSSLRPELKATRYFRQTWSKLSVDKRVTQALAQAPKNAGPINSHRLVLRSLALMRDISPDYLNRFTSYVDTLLCLDQCEKKGKQVPVKQATAAQNSKSTKSRRTRAAQA